MGMDLLKRITSIYRGSASDADPGAGTDSSATSDADADGSSESALARTLREEYAPSKSAQFLELLEANGGRMKQSDIVEETQWSSATVSRALSEMEDEGTIRKISLGRENVITLVGAEPDWYTPPPDATETPDHWTDEPADQGDESAILLVEDNPADARILKEALREANIPNPVHVVKDGADALEFILQQGPYTDAPRPRLVLLDLSLLMVDGIEVLRELKERRPIPGIPLLVLSRSTDPEDIRRAYDYGATAYLAKPDEFPEFVDLVRSIDAFWLSQPVLTAPAVAD